MNLVCLHGWGGSKASFDPLREAMQNADWKLFTPDLPGFGDESEPSKPWTVDDYADFVEKYIRENIQGPYSLLGHSHGGRIAVKLTTRTNTTIAQPDHLYLCAAAGIRRPRHFKRITGLILAKAGKTVLSLPGLQSLEPLGKKLLYKLVRVHDYEKASEIMRKTLILVSQEDLRPLLANIALPTDIFWGENDGMTPIGDAHIMHSEISGSTLHTYPNIRHGVHKDAAKEIARVIIAS